MRRTAADAALTREAITRAALHRFARDGWDGCSLVDVARGAGVTRGAVYHHFSGKMDLLTAVLVEQWAIRARDLLALLDAEAHPAGHALGGAGVVLLADGGLTGGSAGGIGHPQLSDAGADRRQHHQQDEDDSGQ